MEFITKFFKKSDEDEKNKNYIQIPIKLKVIILMIIFLIGFIFFTTSNIWLVTKNDFSSNKIYDTLTLSDDISLKLRRWSYNPDTKQTEIEIGKNFSSVNNNLKFTLNVFGNGTNFIKANIDYDSPTLWVISLNKIPFNTKYIRLEFTVNMNDKVYVSNFNMNLNSDEINIDKNLKLNKTKQEYIYQSISYEAEKSQQTLNKNKKIIEKYKSDIDIYNKEINDLQNNKSTNATKDELEILSKKLNNLNQEIIKLNDLIKIKEEENKSLQDDIKILQAKLDKK